MKPYPKVNSDKDFFPALQYIVKERRNDIADFQALETRVGIMRKVEKVPSGSTNIAASDRVGDFSFDSSYIYLCIESTSSTAEWRRATLSTW